MKFLALVIASAGILSGPASAQVTPTPPFLGDGFEGFEPQPVQGPVACAAPSLFEGFVDMCAMPGGSLRFGNGFGGSGTIFARGGIRCANAQTAGATFTFATPVQEFGAWIGTVASTSGGSATFYDVGGNVLATLPITALACQLNCGWSWNGFDAGSGPRIARIDFLGAGSGGAGLTFDDLFAQFGNTPTGVVFCTGDLTGMPCPCGNNVLNPYRGCYNSTFQGARLLASGAPSLSNDQVVLRGESTPSFASALYFQGSARVAGGAGAVFGDGLRCAGGSIKRLGIETAVGGGVTQYPAPGDPAISVRGAIAGPGTYTYQMWYRDPMNFCTAQTFNLSNGFEILWQP